MHLNNQNGSSLSLILVIMLVLGILGSTLLFLNTSEARQVAKETKKVQAYYIAKSGAEAIAEYIIDSSNNLDEDEFESLVLDLIRSEKSNPLSFGNGIVEIDISGETSEINILSTGKIDSVTNGIRITLKKVGTNYYKIFSEYKN